MDKISNLLREAKPLYFARKKRNNRIKTTLAMFVCVVMVSIFYQNNSYFTYDSWIYDESYVAESSSIIEDMGLPVDEYGLLKVV